MTAPPSPTDTAADRSPVPSVLMAAVGLGLVGWAATSLTGHTELRAPLLGAVVLVAVLGSLGGLWHHRRTQLQRDLAAALAPVMKTDRAGARKMVKITARNAGLPEKIRITYPATFPDSDDKARKAVRQIIATRMGADIEATWETRRRRLLCRVEATATAGVIVESDTPVSPVGQDDTQHQARLRERTTSVVRSIMGAAADVADLAFDGDTPTRIEVKYPTTSRDLSANFRHRVTLSMDSKLPGDWRDNWDLENDRVTFTLRPPFPTNVRYPLLHKFRPNELPFAIAEDHSIQSWKLGSKNPHALVIGPTGSGKTVLIRNLVVAARVLGIPVILCDPKMTEYLDFEDLEGVTVLTDPEHIAKAIERTHDEMMYRYTAIKQRKAKKGEFPRLLFILDEFYIAKEAFAEMWAEEKALNKDLKGRDHPCLAKWRRMAVLARTAGIHLVQGIQRPDAEFLSGLARDSFRFRISLDRTTPEAARMMWGDAHTGTDLPNIQGRGIATGPDGPMQVQVLRLLTPEDDDAFDTEDAAIWNQLVARMNTQAAQHANDPLAFLGHLNTAELGWTAEQRQMAAPAPIAAAADDEGQEPAEAPALPEAAEEEVGVYELEVDQTVLIEGEAVRITDLHFGEDEDEYGAGEEWIEITYETADGDDGEQRLGVDDVLVRKVPVHA
ncbi:FtsK/SpoIIIE domain-containing protein [Streptomyces sp. Ac-502]|uniref:FtsK/SpoIIIE domain-containing protein n=1 Tax=Streptomyces sp. Ac-502 TaxID=3342801 RepID=UPI0038623711